MKLDFDNNNRLPAKVIECTEYPQILLNYEINTLEELAKPKLKSKVNKLWYKIDLLIYNIRYTRR